MARVEVVANLEGHQQVVRGLKDIQDQLGQFGRQVVPALEQTNQKLSLFERGLGQLKTAAAAAGAALATFITTRAVDVLVDSTKAALNYASRLNDLSVQLGVTTEDLQFMEFAARQNGSSLEAFSHVLRRLSALAGGMEEDTDNLRGAFAKYNVEIKNADGSTRNAMDLFRAIADRIKDAETNTERLAIASGFFGRMIGAQMIPILIDGAAGLDRMKEAAREMGLILESDLIRQADEAGDKLDAMSMVIRNNVYAALLELSPVLIEVSGLLADASRGIVKFLVDLGAIGIGDLPQRTQISLLSEQIDELEAKIRRTESAGLGERLVGPILDVFGAKGSVFLNEAALERAREQLKELKAQQQELLIIQTEATNRAAAQTRSRGVPSGRVDIELDNELTKAAIALRKDLMSAEDVRNQRLKEAKVLLDAEKISWVEYGKAIQLANAEYDTAIKSTESYRAGLRAQTEAEREAKAALEERRKGLQDLVEWFERGQKALQEQQIRLTAFNEALGQEEANLRRLVAAQEVSNREREITRVQIELETQLRRINGELLGEDVLRLREHAERMVALQEELGGTANDSDFLTESLQRLGSIGQTAIGSLGSAITGNLRSAGDAFSALRNIGMSAIQDLIKALIEMAIVNPLGGVISGTGGGTGLFNFIGSLLGAGTGAGIPGLQFLGPSPPVGAGGLAGLFQTGGSRIFTRPSLIAVAETGAERVDVRPLAGGGPSMARGGGNTIVIDARGSNGEAEIEKAVRRGLRKFAPGLIEASATVVAARHRANPKYLGG
jgi:hypothetical protein